LSKRTGPKTLIKLARERATAEINGQGRGKYAAGLSSEGYAGGYRDALDDVMLALSGIRPKRRNYWQDAEPGKS
jgi:hypothetical protein